MSALRPCWLTRGVVVISAAVVLAGCAAAAPGPEKRTTTATYATAPCPVPMIVGIPGVDLGPDVVCGSLTVPENRAKPDGRTITLTVATLKAQSPDPAREPMVYLNGGPGSTILPLGEKLRGMAINRDRDVILVSQRGTLLADPQLTCPESDACAAQPGCACAHPDLENEFDTTVQKLAKDPMTVEVPATPDRAAQNVVLDGYKLVNVAVLASMDASRYAGLPQMIHATAEGDGSALAEAVADGVPSPDLMTGGLKYGVVCGEFAPFTTQEAMDAAAKQAMPGFPADVLAVLPQFGRPMDECAAWDVSAADPRVNGPVHSDLPVLVLAGTFDAITQASLADGVAETLPNSTVVRFPAIGHDVHEESERGRMVVASFLNDPQSPDVGCVAGMQIPEFTS